MSTTSTPAGREPAPAEFWDNIPEHFDTSFGVLHDRRYDRPHICGSTVNMTSEPCPACGAVGAL